MASPAAAAGYHGDDAAEPAAKRPRRSTTYDAAAAPLPPVHPAGIHVHHAGHHAADVRGLANMTAAASTPAVSVPLQLPAALRTAAPPSGGSAANPTAQQFMPPQQPPHLVAFSQQPITGSSGRGGAAAAPDLLGLPVKGTVEARFDCGYFVSLGIGGQTFSGILYCPHAAAAAIAATSGGMRANGTAAGNSAPARVGAGSFGFLAGAAAAGSKKSKVVKDPHRPKASKVSMGRRVNLHTGAQHSRRATPVHVRLTVMLMRTAGFEWLNHNFASRSSQTTVAPALYGTIACCW